MADLTELTAAVDALAAQATKSTTTEDGAGVIINGIGASNAKAAADALVAQGILDAAQIKVVTDAIGVSTKAFADADDKLAAAILANTPAGPPVQASRRG